MGRKFILFAAFAYTLILTISSLASLRNVPVEKLELSDKILHGIAYFLLVIIWSAAFALLKKHVLFNRTLIVIGACALLFGIVIEVLQGVLTSYRQADIFDIIANCAGVLLAIGLLVLKRKMKG